VQDLVGVAGQRWKIEESFQTGKELAGLDEHQVRTWTFWHRWTVLAMLATPSSRSWPPPRPRQNQPETTIQSR